MPKEGKQENEGIQTCTNINPQQLHVTFRTYDSTLPQQPQMIIDSSSNMVQYTDNPPAYEYVSGKGPSDADKQQFEPPTQQHGPSSPPLVSLHVAPVPVMPQPRVYHYQNPATGEHVASLLPPDHPEMVCLQQGGHIRQNKFGILGILAAIIWFPLGIGLCLLDRRVQCKRCGALIDEGICG